MNKARNMLIISMAVFGTIGLFVRRIPLASGEIALYRAVLAVVLIGGYLLAVRPGIALEGLRRELPMLFVSGAAMGINWILLFEAYKYTAVSVATLSYSFAPVIVMMACPFLFREKINAQQIFCFGMSTLGLVMMVGVGDAGKGGTDIVGVLFGLGAAGFYAAVILINKFIKGVEGIYRTFLQFLAAIVILIPYVALTSGVNLSVLDGVGWGCLLIVGLVHTGITYCLYFTALKELPGQKTAILSYIDPLVAVCVSVFLLREKMTLWQAVGGLLILGFTFWNELAPDKKRNGKESVK